MAVHRIISIQGDRVCFDSEETVVRKLHIIIALLRANVENYSNFLLMKRAEVEIIIC